MKFNLIQDIIVVTILFVVLFLVIAKIFAPQIATWKSDVSSINEMDWGFVVDIIVYAVMFSPLGIAIILLRKSLHFGK